MTRGTAALGRSAPRFQAANAGKYLALCVVAVIAGYPVLWLVFGSLKSEGEFYTNFWALPSQLRFENYAVVWNEAGIAQALLNSMFLAIATIIVVVVVAIPAAYALVRLGIPGKAWLLAGVLLTLVIEPSFTIVGLFELFADFGLLNTHHGLILVYAATSLPLAIALYVSYMQAIPREIEESAILDGAGPWRILVSIVGPIVGPITSAVAIFTFLSAYNDLILALALWSKQGMATVTMSLAGLIAAHESGYSSIGYPGLFAGTAASLLPVLILYLVFQRRFMSAFISGSNRR